MRSFPLTFWTTLLGAVVFSAFVIGCGGKKDDDDDDVVRRPKSSSSAAASAPTLKPVPAKDGYTTISGKIEWTGDLPSIADFTASLRKEIAGNADNSYCIKGTLPSDPADYKSSIQPFETIEQEFRIGKNKGVGNVFVWIQPEPGYYFDIPKDQLDAIEKEVVLTQPHCSFLPHCMVVFPSYYKDGVQVKTGQKLFIENDARVTHNAKVQGGPLNGSSSITLQPKKGDGSTSRLESLLKPEKEPITVACDVHKWMKAYVRSHDHPYATVSSVGGEPAKKIWENLDSPSVGTFTIKGVPVGAKVKIYAWHERAGFLTPPAGEVITIAKDVKKDFSATIK